jgi:protease IV
MQPASSTVLSTSPAALAARAAGLGLALLLASAQAAQAQVIDRRYLDEPTRGVTLPTTPLAGEHDARALSVNPAGLQFLRGPEALLVVDYQDSAVTNTGGTGGGLFLAGPVGGAILPRLGLGFGVEALRPARSSLLPDPGTPLRGSLGLSFSLSREVSLGVSWHHFFDEGPLDGVDALDAGLSARLGNHLAFGAVIRDLNGPRAAEQLDTSRRYEAELTVRPLGTDRIDLGFGGRVGEERGNVDGWGRLSWRLARGLYAHGSVETSGIRVQTVSGSQLLESDERDLRVAFGFEISLGGFGVTTYGSMLRDYEGNSHALGGGVMLRSSLMEVPSVFAPDDHIERVELSGSLDGFALVALVSRLRAIGRDDSARAVALVFDDVSAGWGALREVRDELVALRQRGVKLYAFLVTGDTRDYYLASVADKIYVDPAGELALTGVASTATYWRGTLDLVGITPEFEKIAEYKGAPEQFTRRGASVPVQRMRAELLDGIWEDVLSSIAVSRRLEVAEVKRLIDAGPYSAGDLAVDAKLVDAVATPERAAYLIGQHLGTLYPVREPARERPATWQRRKIAVIHVQGDIVDGASQTVPLLGRMMAGGETISRAIAAARAAPEVGAIVLRIDSPGGSALASELIAREVFATRGVKPILCSMSNIAASGGYFAAAGCELIFAEPTTVTGSIGIFTGKADLSGLMGRLGVNAEISRRGAHADLGSMTRPYTEEERQLMYRKIQYSYGRFVGAVAEGRNLTRAQVDEIGRGRVWTGARAKEVGLVDRLGGVGDAIDEARRRMRAGDDERVDLLQLPFVEQGPLAQLRRIGGIGEAAGGGQLDALLRVPALRAMVEEMMGGMLSVLWQPGAMQARLPWDTGWLQGE